MSKAPPIPPEQRTFAGREHGSKDPTSRLESAHPERSDLQDKGENVRAQGRHGNLQQNLTPQWKTQDR
jgi:hypothetical protein